MNPLGLGEQLTASESEMNPLEQSDIFVDHIRERLRQHDIQSLRISEDIDRIRDDLERSRRRSISRRATALLEISRNDVLGLMINPILDPSSSFLSGEASVTPTVRDTELLRVTENEERSEKGNKDKGEDDDKCTFFDCNICLEMAKDPVVTCCGHLFCWPCVYQWLSLHSVTNECPVCKGEVTMKNVVPIYGRGNSPSGHEQDPRGPKIPIRPHARSVESVRQSTLRNSVAISMDETLPGGPSSERMVSYILGRDREEQPPLLDDRDSVSSIAAVIQSESQTIDTVPEIDLDVFLSTSTSRRRNRNDASQVSDVDGEDSRTRRRRRMN